jgi:predicted metal-dependent hydrolase
MPSTTPPEAARSIVIAGQAVAYQLRRSQRRTIGLTIDHRGLRVGAPTRARIGDIEKLIHEHGAVGARQAGQLARARRPQPS